LATPTTTTTKEGGKKMKEKGEGAGRSLIPSLSFDGVF
jgi:hypothetical protein